MVMSMLLPVLIMLASYIAIAVVIFRLSSFSFPISSTFTLYTFTE